MNTMLKNSFALNSLYVQNPIETYDRDGEYIELLLPFGEYAEETNVSLGIPITMGTFYNDPTLSGVPDNKFFELNEMSIRLTELKEWSSITHRGLEFKIPIKDFESLLVHKATIKALGNNRYESFVEISYDYDFSDTFLIDFSLNYED